ncbi:MAG: hypothetical protein PHY47_00410 [Lachnospiraceae bacterium]|nr:hypothetical protein [Lachnospiraceae bacterium]
MSQFRIKHIDQGLKDEWVYRKNEDGIQLGDDIDARDPNELAEAIEDIQDVLLKTSSLSAAAILSPTSGIAERLTILENTAGEATLQDIYENGNNISVLSGRPLILGAREEIKIDETGNLSFKPTTMRIRGTGTAYLELSNQSVFTSLGDLLVGAVSPGTNLTLRAGGVMAFQDNYLTTPITLSQSGASQLATASQSIIGAINELKTSTFSVSLQAVYNQSTPPKIATNITSGPIIFEDPNAMSLNDVLRIVGNSSVTKKLTVGSLKIGANTNIDDTNGLITSSKIKTTAEIQTTKLNAELNELMFQDKRINLNLSENGHGTLNTNNGSIIGAINELKSNIDSVGGAINTYDQEHVASTGEHGIITTQASIGQNTIKRLIVKNQTGNETFSVTGEGKITADNITISGMDLLAMLQLLDEHLSDDGTAHSALASHLSASNPHNTVRRLMNLSGDISFASPDGSISISSSGNIVNFSVEDSSTLQSVYDKATSKVMNLNNSGLIFTDQISASEILIIKNDEILPKRNIHFNDSSNEIKSANELTLRANNNLRLYSNTQDILLETLPTKSIKLQSVSFDEEAIKVLPRLEGSSLLGNLKKIDDDKSREATNSLNQTIIKGTSVCLDESGKTWLPISDMHPANEFINLFHFNNSSKLIVAAENINPGSTGKFYKSGMVLADIGTGYGDWEANADLYIARKGYSEIEILDFSQMLDGQTITINTSTPQIIKGVTGVPDILAGEYQIDTALDSYIGADAIRNSIVGLINNEMYSSQQGLEKFRAGIDGESARASIVINQMMTPGQFIEIDPEITLVGEKVRLTAVAESATIITPTQFRIGYTIEETAYNLAEAINSTVFYADNDQLIPGHYCFAEAVGSVVRIRWYLPGWTSRNITIVSDSPDVTVNPFLGGTVKLRIYRQDIGGAVIPVINSNLSAMTSTDIKEDETSSQYIIESRMLGRNRKVANETKIKVGTIEEVSGNNVKFKVK